jgi:nitroreductase
MNLGDALNGRRSVRRYERRPVPRELVQNLIDAAETAPSAGNLRARRYVAVMNPEIIKALAVAAYGQNHLKTAPIVIVICADVDRSSSRYGDRGSLYAIQDAAAATMCLLLKACDLGLGACWNGAFDDDMVRDLLGLEEHILPVALISIGWPTESPDASQRRGMAEVLTWMD